MSATAITVPEGTVGIFSRLFSDGWCGCMNTRSTAHRAPLVEWRGDRLRFALEPAHEAATPAEARGLARDQVRLLVTRGANAPVSHTCVRSLDRFLDPGDLLVINTSDTLPAALDVTPTGRAETALRLHLSQALADGQWIVELRTVVSRTETAPMLSAEPGDVLALPGGATVTLDAPVQPDAPRRRLWIATLALPERAPSPRVPGVTHDPAMAALVEYLERHGEPIRYGYVGDAWPIAAYRTHIGVEPGSAEMPSAGRPITSHVLAALRRRGIGIAPIVLHTGVSSPEEEEPPAPERYRVPRESARLVNAAHRAGHRVVAVGTTVVRALETVADARGHVIDGEGWTDVVITPARGVRAVDGLLTGFHEPRASHLAMLEAIGGRAHLAAAYEEALRHDYLWHELGDVHLMLRA